MKKVIDVLIVLCLFCAAVFGQNVNPQTNYAAEEQMANPSLLLNYNDATVNFADSVSGVSFGGVAPARPTYVAQCTSQPSSAATVSCALTATAGNALVIGIATGAGTISNVADSAGCTPTAVPGSSWASGANLGAAYVCANVGAGSHTITVTLSAAVSYPLLIVQAFSGVAASSPVDGVGSGAFTTTGSAISSGSVTTTQNNDMLVGFGNSGAYVHLYAGAPTFTFVGGDGVNTTGGYFFAESPGSYGFNFTLASGSTGGGALVVALKAAVVTSGAVATQQPGFDNTNPANYSAAFPYNGFAIAPNDTLGAIDWMNPWTMLLHIDRLNWNRTGTLVLASKGDSSSALNNWWKLTLTGPGNGPGIDQLCFARNGANGPGAPFQNAGDTICTNYDLANGYNYDIVVTNNGVGASGAGGQCTGCVASLGLYVNGLNSSYAPTAVSSQSYSAGFGATWESVSGGTGYANSTAFTVTGGGPNCHVAGSMTAVNGVPTTINSAAGQNNYGCTSLPTIVLTSPTGTGATITVHLGGASMNSTTLPLMVPGGVSSGAYNGIDQSDSTQTATNVDEFALFPGVLTSSQIQTLFYLTKMYQGIFPAVPQHIPVIVNEIVCADYDSTTTISVAIRLHQLGYINLLGIAIESDSGVGAAIFRQMLDQAGLADIPLSMASNSNTIAPGAQAFCVPANITAYNASTPQSYTGYPTTASMYRKIFAAHPTTPITLLIPTLLYGMYDFMTSAADSVSPLTGAQLWAQNVTNGGSMYLEGGPTCGGAGPTLPTLPATTPCVTSVTGDNTMYYPTQGQYVIAHLGGMPTYLMEGSPAPNGPGVLVTRTSNDPLYLASVTYGNDSRTAWDSLGTMMILTPVFQGGVQIGYSGGTGYANETAITSTGGGANCHVAGYMSASGGIPNGIHTTWGGYSSASVFSTYGYGCTSAPTLNLVSPTGTGVTLTAYPSTVCGTDTVTQPSGVWTDTFTSSTCSNQYSIIYSGITSSASSGGPSPVYQWMLNSLENPVPVGQVRAQ